ncbi:MAG: hypothetical protein GX112_15195 [Clostridiaceae bacterium]|jgi:hypothetical protein|nr:hypothetical protein [Clostridiaceae bacterium]
MKQSPEQREIEENLKPGAFSADGFLGTDTRSLADIIRDDQALVLSLGLTHQAIARQLSALTALGLPSLGAPVPSGDHLEVVVTDYRGFIPCPFRDYVREEKRLTVCRDRRTGETIRWTDLNVHMIAAHGFYEGRGSPFRVEPAAVQAMLNIQPDPENAEP